MTSTVTGAGRLLRFMLRRERRSLPWWLGGSAFVVAYQSTGSQALYDTPEKLAKLQQTYGANPAMVAFSGPTDLLATIGGEVVFEIFAYLAVIVALMNMFLVTRNTRSEEETGRSELIRSARVGRHAPLAAALGLAVLSNVGVAVLVLAAAAGTGLPVAGSVLLGLATAAVGLFFAGLTAVAVQVYESPRAAYGMVSAALGASFLLRAAGDAGTPGLSWLSPIGWGHRTLPFVADRWWPLLLPLAFGAGLAILAVALLNRRDFGGGLVPTRLGPATAPRSLTTPLGLAWRLQRGSFIGWASGLFIFGLAFGSFTDSLEQFVADNPEVAELLAGGAGDIVDGFLSYTTIVNAILAAAFGISAALRARAEETSGRAEPVLATRTSRWAWLGSYATVAVGGSVGVLLAAALGQGLAYAAVLADPAQIPRLLGAALVQAPATAVLVAVAVLGFGLLPRAAAAIAWAIFGLCTFLAMFGDAIELPRWVRDLSPFAHTPQAPAEPVTAAPVVVVTAIAVALLTAGFAGLRRRDIVSS